MSSYYYTAEQERVVTRSFFIKLLFAAGGTGLAAMGHKGPLKWSMLLGCAGISYVAAMGYEMVIYGSEFNAWKLNFKQETYFKFHTEAMLKEKK